MISLSGLAMSLEFGYGMVNFLNYVYASYNWITESVKITQLLSCQFANAAAYSRLADNDYGSKADWNFHQTLPCRFVLIFFITNSLNDIIRWIVFRMFFHALGEWRM